MYKRLILTDLYLFSMSLYAQSDSPYKITMDGMSSSGLQLLDDISPFRLDSLAFDQRKMMPFSYKLEQLNLTDNLFQQYPDNKPHIINLHLEQFPFSKNHHYDSPLDRDAHIYDTYRFSFMFSHGYFGPSLLPTGGGEIRKSIYKDFLYPWQNSPLTRYKVDKALYLITNFVYPSK